MTKDRFKRAVVVATIATVISMIIQTVIVQSGLMSSEAAFGTGFNRSLFSIILTVAINGALYTNFFFEFEPFKAKN